MMFTPDVNEATKDRLSKLAPYLSSSITKYADDEYQTLVFYHKYTKLCTKEHCMCNAQEDLVRNEDTCQIAFRYDLIAQIKRYFTTRSYQTFQKKLAKYDKCYRDLNPRMKERFKDSIFGRYFKTNTTLRGNISEVFEAHTLPRSLKMPTPSTGLYQPHAILDKLLQFNRDLIKPVNAKLSNHTGNVIERLDLTRLQQTYTVFELSMIFDGDGDSYYTATRLTMTNSVEYNLQHATSLAIADMALLHPNLFSAHWRRPEISVFSEGIIQKLAIDPNTELKNTARLIANFAKIFDDDYPDVIIAQEANAFKEKVIVGYNVEILLIHDAIILLPDISVHYRRSWHEGHLINPINVANALFYKNPVNYDEDFIAGLSSGREKLKTRTVDELTRDTERIWVLMYRALAETFRIVYESERTIANIEFIIPSQDLKYPFYIKLRLVPVPTVKS